MEKSKIKVEIYEDDPFGSACCGPGPSMNSPDAMGKLRRMLTERSQTIEKLSKEFKDTVQIERNIISQKRRDYPEYVRRLMFDDKPLPYVFLDGETAVTGKFPSYEEFVALLKAHLET